MAKDGHLETGHMVGPFLFPALVTTVYLTLLYVLLLLGFNSIRLQSWITAACWNRAALSEPMWKCQKLEFLERPFEAEANFTSEMKKRKRHFLLC